MASLFTRLLSFFNGGCRSPGVGWQWGAAGAAPGRFQPVPAEGLSQNGGLWKTYLKGKTLPGSDQ